MARGLARRFVLFAGVIGIAFLLWNHAKLYAYFGHSVKSPADQRTTSITQTDEQAHAAKIAALFQNERLKLFDLPDRPIENSNGYAGVEGVWVAEPSANGNKLLQPEQVDIVCMTNALYPDEDKMGECAENRVTLGVMKGMISIMGPDQTVYKITKWDKDGIAAFYTDDGSSKCHLEILTISFKLGRVLLSEIPTNKQGCEGIDVTDSYRLVRGEYYIDTTEKNNGDKPER